MKPTTLERSELREFFQPFADAAHKAKERVHLHRTRPEHIGNRDAEWHTHGAGYVCGVTDDAVAKYSSGTNSTDWMAFNTINRITVHGWPDGELIREILITDKVEA